jgi:hypothetical protein
MVHWLVAAMAILLNCTLAPSPFGAFVLRMLSIPSLSFMLGFSLYSSFVFQTIFALGDASGRRTQF